MSFEYFFILLILFIAATFLKIYFKIKLFNTTKELLFYYFIIIVIGTVWDNFAIARGHWLYPGKGITGIFIGFAPIEDYFFIVICTYFALVIYKVLYKKSPKH